MQLIFNKGKSFSAIHSNNLRLIIRPTFLIISILIKIKIIIINVNPKLIFRTRATTKTLSDFRQIICFYRIITVLLQNKSKKGEGEN